MNLGYHYMIRFVTFVEFSVYAKEYLDNIHEKYLRRVYFFGFSDE